MSIIKYTQEIILRDLGAMKDEIRNTDQGLLWSTEAGITNSVGTLCYHICGNLRHFIGAVIGKDNYIRDREAEFQRTYMTKDEILITIDETIKAVESALKSITEKDLKNKMSETPPQHNGKTIGFFLIQLCCHLSRHRGQLDYLRRISKARNK